MLVHEGEMARFAEEDCLELEQLDVWDEPRIAHIFAKRLLQGQHSLTGNVPLFFGFVPARKAFVQGVQVKHGGKTGVGMPVLTEEVPEEGPHRLVAPAAAPGNLTVPPPAGRTYRPHHLYAESCQVQHQHAPDVLLLGLTFDIEI